MRATQPVNATSRKPAARQERIWPRDSDMGSKLRMAGAQELDRGAGLRGEALGEGGEIDRTVAQDDAKQSGAQEGEVTGAPRVAAQFAVFLPGDIASVVIGAFDAPMAATACEPLPTGKGGARGGGDEETGFAGSQAGFLVGHGACHGDDGGGMGKAHLNGCDRGEHQVTVLGAAMVAVVGEKRGVWPCTACAAAASTADALPLS